MKELKSVGKVLDKEFRLQVGSMLECTSLKIALVKALKAEGIKLDVSGWDFSKGSSTEIGDIGGILDVVLGVIADEGLEKVLYKLGAKCLIGSNENAVKIDMDFFEPVENRKYYFPVMGIILKENLAPFIEGLSLESLIPSGLIEKVLGSKSQPKT